MRLLVPYLFPGPQLWATAASDLHLPALQKLAARGRMARCPADGVEAALCEALGIARQQDYPVAAWTLKADGGEPGEHYWLRADPVHLAVMRDRIVVAGTPALDAHEAADLTQSIKDFFGPLCAPDAVTPTRWYLRVDGAVDLCTHALPQALGGDAAQFELSGDDAAGWRSRMSELQMLLHTHPVNEAREARGAPTVNALWLWGGGVAQPVSAKPLSTKSKFSKPMTLAAQGPDRRALAQAAGVACLTPEPQHWPMLTVLDTVHEAGQAGDVHGWREGMRKLEVDWFRALARRRLGCVLEDPVHGRQLVLRGVDFFKIWQRSRSLRRMVF